MKSRVQKNDKNKANSTPIITNTSPKRRGWEKAFKQMAANGDDKLLIPDVFEDEVFADWKW